MFLKHLFIILSGLILVSSILGQNCPFIKCPPGWKMWRRACYRFTPSLPWVEANESCQAMEGEMAAPRSQAEQDFFVKYSTEENIDRILIACNDLGIEGQWMCNNIDQTEAFTFWSDGEPDNDGVGEDCAAMYIPSSGIWYDAPCDNQHPALCRRDPY